MNIASMIFSLISLLLALAAFTNEFFIQVDDLKLMVTNKPLMGGNHQQVTVSTGTSMTFINMGKRPISITSVDFFLVETDETGTPLHSDQVKQFQVQPSVVKEHETITKEISTSDSPMTFRPMATTGSETIKLEAHFVLVTPSGSTYASVDLSDFSLPASGTTVTFGVVVAGPPGAANPLSPPTTLYHNWSFAPAW